MRVTTAGQIIAWVLAALLLAANVAGYRYDLYKAAWWFDRVLHGSTLFALSFWLAIVVFARGINENHRILGFLMIAAVGVACGGLWEVGEWAFNQMVPADVIKGKYDTILDIIMDTIGAVIAAGLVQFFLVGPTRQGAPAPAINLSPRLR